MILFWRSQRYPWVTQKLGFNAPRNINRAWQEAQNIRRLLLRAGDYQARDMKILAFGLQGALIAFSQEHRININQYDSKVIATVIKQINRKTKDK